MAGLEETFISPRLPEPNSVESQKDQAYLRALLRELEIVFGRTKETFLRLTPFIRKRRDTENATLTLSTYHCFGNTDGGGFTYTLPSGVNGGQLRIVNTGTSGNDLTIAPNGSDSLRGSNTNFTLSDGEILSLIYDSQDGWY